MEEKIIEIITKKEIKFDNLKKLLNITNKELSSILEKLIFEGKIFLSSEKKYCILKPEYIVDTLKSGFKSEKYVCSGRDKIIIPKEQLHTALKYDVVVVDRTYENYGKVIGILKRENKKLVCEVREKNNQLYLVPFNENCELTISCDNKLLRDYIIGDRVYFELDDYSLDDDNNVVATNIVKLGHFNDKSCDEIAIAVSKGFDIDFSEEALREAETTLEEVTDEDLVDRLDLTEDDCFTIDSIKV